jgi:hypothetical protein
MLQWGAGYMIFAQTCVMNGIAPKADNGKWADEVAKEMPEGEQMLSSLTLPSLEEMKAMERLTTMWFYTAPRPVGGEPSPVPEATGRVGMRAVFTHKQWQIEGRVVTEDGKSYDMPSSPPLEWTDDVKGDIMELQDMAAGLISVALGTEEVYFPTLEDLKASVIPAPDKLH